MTSPAPRVPLRGILAVFTLWIAASTAYMAWMTLTTRTKRSVAEDVALLALCGLFTFGIYLILARRKAARRYWISALSAFELLALPGLLTPVPTRTRQIQVTTIIVFALAIGYWMWSERVRRTFRLSDLPVPIPAPPNTR